MPLTFLAHQGPFLPVVRKAHRHVDGLTFVIGSMAPDLAYVFDGSRFAFWAHTVPMAVVFCVPVTLVVSRLIVQLLARVVPDHLPRLGQFNLPDYRGLAAHPFAVGPAVAGALLGALSHIGLDSFTHGWGWFARNVSWYDDIVVGGTFLGQSWTLFRVIQYVGHVGGSALCLALLWRYGRERWMADPAARVAPFGPTLQSHVALWTPTAVGAVAAVLWAESAPSNVAADILRLAGLSFAGLGIGSATAVWVRPVVNTHATARDVAT